MPRSQYLRALNVRYSSVSWVFIFSYVTKIGVYYIGMADIDLSR